MTDSYRIIVGHDLEGSGDEAVEQAYALAARIARSEIHILHTLSTRGRRDVAASSKKIDEAIVELRARVTPIARRWTPAIPTQLHVRLGTVLETIQQIAVDYDASLVLVGTHGYRGVEGLSHRSIAARLVRIARLPVLVAHAKDFSGLTATPRPEAARPGEDLHHERAMSEVLIAPERVSHVAGLV
jgi:nucleotide-binding universal stress UspA family protein